MDINSVSYREGLASDGLARFVDSTGEAWLIPVKDQNGGTDGGAEHLSPGRYGLLIVDRT